MGNNLISELAEQHRDGRYSVEEVILKAFDMGYSEGHQEGREAGEEYGRIVAEEAEEQRSCE